MTAEIVGAILDVAIARCRSHAFAVRRDHDKTAKFMRKLERRVRDAQSEAARDFHEADVDFVEAEGGPLCRAEEEVLGYV